MRWWLCTSLTWSEPTQSLSIRPRSPALEAEMLFSISASPLRGEDSVAEPPSPDRRMQTTDVHYFGASASGKSKLLSKHSVTPLISLLCVLSEPFGTFCVS